MTKERKHLLSKRCWCKPTVFSYDELLYNEFWKLNLLEFTIAYFEMLYCNKKTIEGALDQEVLEYLAKEVPSNE